MKSLFACTAILFSICVSATYTCAEEDNNRFTINLNTSYLSQFIGNPAGGTIYEHDVFQQSIVVIDNPTGIYGGLWSSISPRG